MNPGRETGRGAPAVGVSRQFVSGESEGLGRAGAGGHPCQGLWHQATIGRPPTIGVIATHYEVDFSEHYLAEPLASRGLGVLGWNTRYRGAGAYFRLEAALADIAVGVSWLRAQGIRTVVALGNSGGASLMAAYQAGAVAQPDRYPAVDLFVSLNAHPGRPDILTKWLDPSVTHEEDSLSREPALDMFDPAHGPPYSAEFQIRYRAAQVERNHRITAWCRQELARRQEAGAGDRLFAVHRTWADLRFLDLTLDPSDRSPGCYAGPPRAANYGPAGLASMCTLRSWLAMWSLEASECRAELHLQAVEVPALVVQSTDDLGCYPSDAQTIHAALASKDRTLEFVRGDHYLRQPESAMDEVADRVAAWVLSRAG